MLLGDLHWFYMPSQVCEFGFKFSVDSFMMGNHELAGDDVETF